MDHARRLIDMQMRWRMQRDDVKKKTSMDRNEHDIEVPRTPKSAGDAPSQGGRMLLSRRPREEDGDVREEARSVPLLCCVRGG